MGGRESSSPSYTPFQRLAIDISQTQPLRLDAFNEAVKSAINRQIGNLQSQLADIQKQKLSGLEFALTSAVGTTQYNPYAGKITSAIERLGQEKTQPLVQTEQDILTQYGKIAPETAQLMKMAGAVKAVPTEVENIQKRISELQKQKEALQQQLEKASTSSAFFGFRKQEQEPTIDIESIQSQIRDIESQIGQLQSRIETLQPYGQEISSHWQQALPKAEQFISDTTNLLRNLGATDEEIQQALSPFYQTMEAGQRSALSYAPYPMFGKTALLGLSKNNLDYGG